MCNTPGPNLRIGQMRGELIGSREACRAADAKHPLRASRKRNGMLIAFPHMSLCRHTTHTGLNPYTRDLRYHKGVLAHERQQLWRGAPTPVYSLRTSVLQELRDCDETEPTVKLP